jgi:hypothetical protein
MEPLTPQDPLWKLLGRARPVEPRGDFTQNVIRAARQTPQERGAWSVIKAWFSCGTASPLPRLAFAGAAVMALVFTAVSLLQPGSGGNTAKALAHSPAAFEVVDADDLALEEPTVEQEWQSADQMAELLAVEDTSMLTDREIAMLLY